MFSPVDIESWRFEKQRRGLTSDESTRGLQPGSAWISARQPTAADCSTKVLHTGLPTATTTTTNHPPLPIMDRERSAVKVDRDKVSSPD